MRRSPSLRSDGVRLPKWRTDSSILLAARGERLLERHDATGLFELVNKRDQRQQSIILTSNKRFGQWDEIFPDTALATALRDRLLHRATTITIRGERHRRQAGLAGPPHNAGGTHPPRNECPLPHR